MDVAPDHAADQEPEQEPDQEQWRLSRLGPVPGQAADAERLTLGIADLHNHSLHSDGRGDPELAFSQMQAAGLDIAALTDHASIPPAAFAGLGRQQYPDDDAVALARLAPRSFDDSAWLRTAQLADKHDVPGVFTALRGFEWTDPWLGHVNVWFSSDYLQVTTPGSLSGLNSWLVAREPQALFGYNHPGREPGRLAAFSLPDDPLVAASLQPRMVAVEAFNRTDDFLFAGYAQGQPSGLVDCLDAGWRPGLIGCSDEHSRSYGLAGKGRTGLWLTELSRAGVREALLARRSFATREVGLRLDARLDDVPMGAPVSVRPGSVVQLQVDLGGSAYQGRTVELQLLSSARALSGPAGTGLEAGAGVVVVHRSPAVVGAVTTVSVQLPDEPFAGQAPGTPGWLVLRVADPSRSYGAAAPRDHPASCWALGYASPWWL